MDSLLFHLPHQIAVVLFQRVIKHVDRFADIVISLRVVLFQRCVKQCRSSILIEYMFEGKIVEKISENNEKHNFFTILNPKIHYCPTFAVSYWPTGNSYMQKKKNNKIKE